MQQKLNQTTGKFFEDNQSEKVVWKLKTFQQVLQQNKSAEKMFFKMIQEKGDSNQLLVNQLLQNQETKYHDHLQRTSPFNQIVDYPKGLAFSSNVEDLYSMRQQLRIQIINHKNYQPELSSSVKRKMLEAVYQPNQRQLDSPDMLNQSFQLWLKDTGAFKWNDINETQRIKLKTDYKSMRQLDIQNSRRQPVKATQKQKSLGLETAVDKVIEQIEYPNWNSVYGGYTKRAVDAMQEFEQKTKMKKPPTLQQMLNNKKPSFFNYSELLKKQNIEMGLSQFILKMQADLPQKKRHPNLSVDKLNQLNPTDQQMIRALTSDKNKIQRKSLLQSSQITGKKLILNNDSESSSSRESLKQLPPLIHTDELKAENQFTVKKQARNRNCISQQLSLIDRYNKSKLNLPSEISNQGSPKFRPSFNYESLDKFRENLLSNRKRCFTKQKV